MRGVSFAIFAAVFWSASMMIFDLLLYNVSFIAASTWRAIFLSLIITIFAIPHCKHEIRKITTQNLILLSIGGIIDLGVGGILLYLGIAIVKVAKASVLTAALPLFSELLAIIFLKEKVTIFTFIGTLLIVCGTCLVTLIS